MKPPTQVIKLRGLLIKFQRIQLREESQLRFFARLSTHYQNSNVDFRLTRMVCGGERKGLVAL